MRENCKYNEATSARVALLLQKRGITRIHPLAGGIDAWLANKFPLESPEALTKTAEV